MKTPLLIFTLALLILSGLAQAAPPANTVTISPNVNGVNSDVPAGEGLPGITALAGKTVINPAPYMDGIPNGSTIIGVDKFGEIFVMTPGSGNIDSIYISGLSLSSFELTTSPTGPGGGPVTTPTLPPVDTGLVTLSEHIGLTMYPDTTFHDNEKLENDKPATAESMDGISFLVMILTGREDLMGGSTYHGPTLSLDAIDAFNASNESPPDVVPVVGDLGGPVDEIL